jgi:hypothetical protein
MPGAMSHRTTVRSDSLITAAKVTGGAVGRIYRQKWGLLALAMAGISDHPSTASDPPD